jgi:multidrug efflux system membrane fusion protein
VPEGATVAAGEVIARIDLRDRESRLREAEAFVAQRTLEFEAARKLGERQFQSATRVAEARTQLEAAKTLRHDAELDLRRTEVRAPFAGVLERRLVEVGDYAEPGEEVALVIEQDPFLVAADAPESVVGRLQVGEEGTALLADGRALEGRVRYVATQAEPATRTFRVELEVPNPGGERFPAGMSARVVLRESEEPAHRISAASLVLADDGRVGVKAVDETGRVAFHPARIVRSETDAVWLGGLPERLRVIVTGGGFVAAGEVVDVEEQQDGASPEVALNPGAPA